MEQPGYVYILVNPSANEFLKIGKTERDPEARAKELSSATGVPTPFYVAFQSYFQDCTRAEAFVHERLAQYRVANNREFFRVPLRQAIDTILEAEKILKNTSMAGAEFSTSDDDDLLDDFDVTSDEPWQPFYEEAENHYYGLGDALQDYEEALRLYKQAAKLGCQFAYRNIGAMYRDGNGCIADKRVAMDYFKEGARNGDGRCWAEMAHTFHVEKHYDNAEKCWDRYFSSRHFEENITYGSPWNRSRYCVHYLMQTANNGREVRYKDKIVGIKNEVLERCRRLMEGSSSDLQWSLQSLVAQIESW